MKHTNKEAEALATFYNQVDCNMSHLRSLNYIKYVKSADLANAIKKTLHRHDKNKVATGQHFRY